MYYVIVPHYAINKTVITKYGNKSYIKMETVHKLNSTAVAKRWRAADYYMHYVLQSRRIQWAGKNFILMGHINIFYKDYCPLGFDTM
jgi:hypothetical protein